MPIYENDFIEIRDSLDYRRVVRLGSIIEIKQNRENASVYVRCGVGIEKTVEEILINFDEYNRLVLILT